MILDDARVADALRHAGIRGGDGTTFPFGRGPADPRAVALLTSLQRSIGRTGEGDRLLVEEVVAETVSRVLWRADARSPASADRRRSDTRAAHRDAVEDVRAYVTAHLLDDIGLDDIAAAVGLSPFHVSRLFRRETGRTLFSYRRDLRILSSIRDLLQSPDDIADIALRYGFASHAHYTASFADLVGVPPSRIRQAGRSPSDVRSLRARVWGALGAEADPVV